MEMSFSEATQVCKDLGIYLRSANTYEITRLVGDGSKRIDRGEFLECVQGVLENMRANREENLAKLAVMVSESKESITARERAQRKD
jgi:hypothetical protein